MDRMTMNDACDEIFNSRLPAELRVPRVRYHWPTTCTRCGTDLEDGSSLLCDDCT